MPFSGTAYVLTFNLINILSESVNRSNSLFLLTFQLTAKVKEPWTTDEFTKTVFLSALDCIEEMASGVRSAVQGLRIHLIGWRIERPIKKEHFIKLKYISHYQVISNKMSD